MPRKVVVEYECDRCGRVWYKDYRDGEEPPEVASLKCELNSPDQAKPAREVNFEALCESCYQTVVNLIDSMDKLEKRSPKAKAKEEPKSSPKDKPTPKPGTSSGQRPAASRPTK